MKRFIKNYYFLPVITVLVLVSVIAVRCKKPTDGIVINVNTSGLFHYTAVVQVIDPSGSNPGTLNVALAGPNAAAIYGIDGKKALAAPGGIIAIAVHPKMEPTAAAPLKFTLTVTGPNYLPLTIPVTIKSTDSTQVIKANILNLAVPTAGVGSTAATGAAVAGTVATPITVTTAPTAGSPAATTVTVPATTRLQDANGATISSSSVAVNVNTFNTAQQTAVNLFPGSSLSSENVVDNTGTTTSKVLLPAGFVNVSMTAAGQEVKKFSAPINVTMTLNPSYKLSTTGAAITTGSVLGIYSYDTGTAQWKFEQNATVSLVGGNPVVTFPTSHLTVFFAGEAVAPALPLLLSFTAPWYQQDVDYNITMVATLPSGPTYEIYRQVFQLDKTLATKLDGKIPVPSVGQPVTLTFFDNTGGQLGTVTLSVSSSGANIALTQPASFAKVTLTLKLACGSTSTTSVASIVTPPDFYLFYKATGAPITSYTLLGTVESGSITTQQLSPTLAYDFKAVLNKNVKEVNNHTVAENTPANQTVGGTFNNGTKVPAQNQFDVASLCSTLP